MFLQLTVIFVHILSTQAVPFVNTSVIGQDPLRIMYNRTWSILGTVFCSTVKFPPNIFGLHKGLRDYEVVVFKRHDGLIDIQLSTPRCSQKTLIGEKRRSTISYTLHVDAAAGVPVKFWLHHANQCPDIEQLYSLMNKPVNIGHVNNDIWFLLSKVVDFNPNAAIGLIIFGVDVGETLERTVNMAIDGISERYFNNSLTGLDKFREKVFLRKNDSTCYNFDCPLSNKNQQIAGKNRERDFILFIFIAIAAGIFLLIVTVCIVMNQTTQNY